MEGVADSVVKDDVDSAVNNDVVREMLFIFVLSCVTNGASVLLFLGLTVSFTIDVVIRSTGVPDDEASGTDVEIP